MTQALTFELLTVLEDYQDASEEVFVFPVSFAQKRLWFLDQFEPGSPFYNIPSAVRLSGELDVAILEQTLNEIVRRHEVLRTTFATMDEEPVQLIAPALELPLLVKDLRDLPKPEREAEALQLATEEAMRPFDLTRGPLLRVTLLQLEAREYIVLLTMHHIISDGWSMGVLIGEIAAIYGAFSSGRSAPLPELPIQYADFAHWQREWLQGEVLEAQISYWKQQLAGGASVLELPTDRPRPAVQTNRGATLSRKLPADLIGALKALGQRERVTQFMTLLAAFQTLLYRYSDQLDVSVGSPIANRNRAEIEGLIGFFVNTLVLRADFSGAPTFRELLQRVREVMLGAYAHQDLPFEMLVEVLQPERDMSRSPLFQVMFILQNAPVRAQRLPGLALEMLDVHSGSSTFDLTLSMAEEADGMDAAIEFNTDLFDASTIESMLEHFQVLLEGVVADPDQPVSRLPLLTADERRRLLVEWNDAVADYSQRQDLCVHQLFEAQVERTPDAVAVVFPATDETTRPERGEEKTSQHLTYRGLNQRANQLAHCLQKLGVGPETVVGVCVERSPEMIVSALGVLKAGGAYLPIDPLYPQERLAFMLQDSQVPVLLTQASLLAGLPAHNARTVCLDADWETIACEQGGASVENPVNSVTPENLVYMIYTSGSTGQSKGVMIQQRSLVNAYLAWEGAYQLRDVSTHLQMANFSFDVFSGDLVRALCSGGKLVVCPREWLLAPQRLYGLMRREGVACGEFVPAVLRNLVQHLDETGERLDFMRVLACGSDSWYVEEYRNFLHLCGPETRLINSFGLTEATIDSSYFEATRLDLSADQMVPIGRPFANMRLYILDAQLQPVPVGIPGELCVGDRGVARGYHDRPEMTAEKFIPDPFGDKAGARLYKTGDLAHYLPNGHVEFLGRLDHQIKIRGFRIEPGEIEALLGRHPAVQQAAVVAAEVTPGDPSSGLREASRSVSGAGRADKRLAAYVVSVQEPAPTSVELRRFLQEWVPDYMVPSAFVLLEALPLTPNGKVDRKVLPAPDWSQRVLEGDYVAPRTPVEEVLSGVWAQVLGVEQVGIYDNFFELGGHSLLATQLVSRVREAFEIELPLRYVFESPTVAALAERVEVAQRTEAGVQAPPIRPVERVGPLPLSFAQQRLWFLDQLEPNSPFYNLPEAVRLTGPLDATVLEKCLNHIVRRHEVLRTTFKAVDGRPVQIVAPELRVPMPVLDLRHLPETEREAEGLRLARVEAQRPFDLARGPLLRARLLRMGDEDWIILLTMHHISGDDWSTSVLIQEIAVLYDAFSRGRPSPLPPLFIQYADFSHWQRNWLQGEVLQTHLSYWKQHLAGLPPLLELPTDRARPAVQTYAGDYLTFVLSKDLSQALKDLCRHEGATLFMTLLAAFQTLLYRYSGQDDVCVGSPIANRNRAETEGLIGFFVNTLVLRTDLSGHPTFRELLRRVREVALGAYAHQDLSFEMIVDAVQPERAMSHSPLFQVMFALQNAPLRAQELPNLTISPVEAHSGTAKFDLTLFMAEDGEQLAGALEYNTDLFDATTIERLLKHLEILLAGIVADPDQPISAAPLLTQDERLRLLVEWNATLAPYPQDRCVHQLFETQVEQSPDAIAVTFRDECLTYAELNRRANQLAHHLQKLGVGPETLVGICVERSPEVVVGLLGILKAGGAYLPIDPTYPQERIAFMLQDAQAAVLLTQQHLAERLLNSLLLTPYSLLLDTDWQTIAQESTENPISVTTPENLAYVIYTSGSTGLPKGAMIFHRGVVNYVTWCQRAYPLEAGTGAPVHSSISFDLTVTGLFAPLLTGRRVKLLPEDVGVEALHTALREESDYSLVKITPAHLELLSQQLTPQEMAGRTRAFIIGGENLLAESVAFWQQHAPGTLLVNEYGPTETVVGCCVYQVPPGERKAGSVPIGRPIINTQLYILDAHLRPAPIGVPGELYIGGAGVARGYLNRPELTAGRFIPDPFSPPSFPPPGGDEGGAGARLYKTGDLARYLPDGNIEFLGRADHQVKLRGFRIELGEIEAVLSQHPLVRETIVLARDGGESPGDKRLVAYVVPESGALLSAAELRGFLLDSLPEYMLPATFATLEALPLTPNGKVDRRALPAPDLSRPELEAVYVAPRTPEEEILAGVWAQILGLERVGAFDDFFELGGHSLLATQVISRLRDAFDIELPLRALFEAPTVAGLAASVEKARLQAQGLSVPAIEPVSRAGELPLSFAQQRLWFLDQMEPESALYNIPTAVRLTGPLDVAALERSLNEIVRRHEALRTAIATVDGRPVQVISPQLTLTIPVVDLCDLPATEREAQARRLAMQEARLPFDLSRGPLLRVCLLKLGGACPETSSSLRAEPQAEGSAETQGRRDEHIALLTMHHIVSDDWSLGILVQELAVLYVTFFAGGTSPLPDLPIQYADFAHWQRGWLQGETLETQLAYWRQQLEGLPPLLELPTDRPRPAIQTFRGAQRIFALPQDVFEALKALSREAGATLFITLLAAFQTLLYRYTGQSDISVGTPIANRTRSEVEGLIGFFVNTLVMRADLGGEPSFRELLKRVREVALGAYAHQDVPFEMLVDQLRPERDMSHSPLFQVMLVLQNAPRQAQELSAGLTLDVIEADDGTARFDLTLTMVEDAGGLSGALEYNTDLFDAATIERMVEHLQVLLAAIVAEPDRSVSELPLLTDVERRRLLADWNDTLTDYPYGLERCVHALFEAQVEQTPQATALIFEDQRLTYTELNQRANQLAHHLRKLGVGPETLVGISVERSPEMVVGLLGILKAGGAYLPIDPTYPQERIVFMLQDAQAAVLLTQQHLVERLSSPLLLTPYSLLLDAGWETIARESQENPIGVTTPENLAYVIYTSGSTGRPKGVLLRHRGLCNLVNAQTRAFGVSADSRVLQFASFSFDASVSETFMALLSGATLYLARQETLTSLPDLFQLLRELKITTVTLPPSVLKALPAEGLDDLQTLVSAGEACSPDVVARWAPGRRFFNAYGPTEATIGPALGRVEDLPQGTANVPIGRPISNTHIYVLDARSRPVAVGVPGELHVGGAGVARGYLNRPELTAVKFVPDPFSPTPGARLYRTGDRARFWADGRLEFLGRIDQQVKVRGFRIELGEIEALLSRHAALQAAVAVVRQDEAGHKRLVAYVVPAQGPAPSSSEMRAFLLEKLPEYMLPSLFVVLDALPLTPNGKVDRRVLPAPDQARPELASVYVAPRTPEEETLAGIWAQILGLEQVGVHDNFFELGGDSILSIQVIARANQAGLRLTPKELFQYPTVAGLVAVADKAPALHAEQGIVAGPLPLTPIQRWFFEQELPEPQHWNQALLLEVEQALEPWPLAATVRQLLEHHDALRLRFARDETGWEQINAGLEGDVPFTWVNLSALPPREQGRAVEATAADLQTSLDLTAGPLLRVAYFDLGVRRAGRLLMVVHHLAVDEASWPILLQDFQLAYEQLRRGRKVMLPPKTTSFQHWARNLAAYAQTEQVREELTYWLAALPGQVTLLPVDDPQGDNTEAVRLNAHDEASARSVMVSLTAEETSALLDEVPEAYRTETEDVLLTALVQAFEPWTGRRALRVHLKGHGREDILEGVDVSRTVGWFTSLFPVHLDLKAAAGLGEALQTVKEQLRQVPGGGMGYGLLRYLHANQPATLQLQALAQPEVSFGYWEQLEQFLPEPAPLRRAQESPGPDRYPGAKRSHVLDVQASIVEGQLQLEWVYSENLHRRATVERLAEGFVTALRALIAHCQSPEAGGYTLSDFADFEWSQEDFEDILAEIGRLG